MMLGRWIDMWILHTIHTIFKKNCQLFLVAIKVNLGVELVRTKLMKFFKQTIPGMTININREKNKRNKYAASLFYYMYYFGAMEVLEALFDGSDLLCFCGKLWPFLLPPHVFCQMLCFFNVAPLSDMMVSFNTWIWGWMSAVIGDVVVFGLDQLSAMFSVIVWLHHDFYIHN